MAFQFIREAQSREELGHRRNSGDRKRLGRAVTTDLLFRAKAGDGEAFRELTNPHRIARDGGWCAPIPRPSARPRRSLTA
jgi:hypothetical protein